jgi:DeoR family transcriptional regulator, fructose operon transcriptional repressor
MKREERLLIISELLLRNKRISNSDLAERFGLTFASIRRDIEELAARGGVQKIHGGAILIDNRHLSNASTFYGSRFSANLEIHTREKEAIGRATAALIQDGDTLLIDGGTTTLEVARNLFDKHHLTVITCSFINIWQELVNKTDSQVFITGGFLRPQTLSLLGDETENMIHKYRATKTILGIDSVSTQFGFTTMNFLEAGIKRTMIESTPELIIVADHSKFGKVCPIPVADLTSAKTIVTDSGISTDITIEIEKLGVKVIIAEP